VPVNKENETAKHAEHANGYWRRERNLLSRRIIGCALTVIHALGTGFLDTGFQSAHPTTSFYAASHYDVDAGPTAFAGACFARHYDMSRTQQKLV
jgi:hypothetical protein